MTHRTQDNTKMYKATQQEIEEDHVMTFLVTEESKRKDVAEYTEMFLTGNHQPPLSPPLPETSLVKYSKKKDKTEVTQAHPLQEEKEKGSHLQELKRQAQIAKAQNMKKKWLTENSTNKKSCPNQNLYATTPHQNQSHQNPQSHPQSHQNPQSNQDQVPQISSLNLPTSHLPHQPCLKYAKYSCQKKNCQIPKSGTTAEDLEDGLTMVTKVRTRSQQTTRNIRYNDSRFDQLDSDVRDILDRDNIEINVDCISYIRDNVYFNGGSTLGMGIVQFEGVNRHARCDEIFCSFFRLV